MTGELRKKVKAIVEAGDLWLNPPEDLAEFIDKSGVMQSRENQILQAFNQFLIDQEARIPVTTDQTRWAELRLEIEE